MTRPPLWIELDGAVNVRDVGGLPLADGGQVIANRLIRADNLQQLSPRDVNTLLDEHDVRAIVDLRSTVEVVSEGPGPLHDHAGVTYLHASLFPETPDSVAIEATDNGPVVLPWHNRSTTDRRSAAQIYTRYLIDRSDSVLAALRLVAASPGATIVHCAAGKDRTGVIAALALDAVGVTHDAIVEDFMRTGERTLELLTRLAASPTYARDQFLDEPHRHRPKATSMEHFLQQLYDDHGGTARWLATAGWTADDQRRLTAKLTA